MHQQSTHTSLFSPLCICNLSKHAHMNHKLQEHTSTPRMVDRVLEPRPEMDSRCTTHRSYQCAEQFPLHKNRSTTVNEQFAELTHVGSQLRGLCRSSAFNTMPHPPSPVKNNSPLWNAFGNDKTVALRLPFSPVSTSISTSIQQSQCAKQCVKGVGDVQTRGPWMDGAPDCQPIWTDEQTHAWNSDFPCNNTEPWRWNNHPFMLEWKGVKRNTSNVPCVPPVQDAFGNSTRRKLIVK